MVDPLIPVIAAAGFSLLFAVAAIHKFSARQSFRAIVEDYRVLPKFFVPAAAIAIPLVEASIAATWLVGPSLQVASAASAIVLLGYAFAMAINLVRGRTDINCGCGVGRSGSGHRLSWWLIARNLCLASTASVASLPLADRDLVVGDYVTATATLLTLVLLYAGTSQLVQNNAGMRAKRREHV